MSSSSAVSIGPPPPPPAAPPEEGGWLEKKCLNSELWHACAGPLVCLPTVGTRVVYFPQGHSEQVAASTNKEVEGHIPNYPNLPAQLICQLHDVTMHADVETDEVYAQMTLQPLNPVGWDESTAGERPPRVSLWEIEPLTTFPMYPSLFPLRVKHPWYSGVASLHDDSNALMWLRGVAGEGGFQSLNFQSPGIGSWGQQRLHPSLLSSDHDQYQAVVAAAAASQSSSYLKQQFLHLPMQSPQEHCNLNPLLQQQILQQASQQQIISPEAQNIQAMLNPSAIQQQLHQLQQMQQVQSDQKQKIQPDQTYQVPSGAVLPSPTSLPSHLREKFGFTDPNVNSTSFITSSSSDNMLDSNFLQGSSKAVDLSRFNQPVASEQQQQQAWKQKFMGSQSMSFGGSVLHNSPISKDGSVEKKVGRDVQNQTLFSPQVDSSSLLYNMVPNLTSNVADNNLSAIPSGSNYLQNPIYGCLDDSSSLLQNTGENDPTTRTFVKIGMFYALVATICINHYNT
ncbi:hypothetical protein ABZP36_007023 [Zizania latifolia]